MIPYDVDPSLHPAQPAAPQLDDGFAPPQTHAQAAPRPPGPGDSPVEPVDPSLWDKSEF